MSLKIDEYLSYYGGLSAANRQGNISSVDTESNAESGGDSYISSADHTEEALPCENYNNILKMVQSASTDTNQMQNFSDHSEDSENAQSQSKEIGVTQSDPSETVVGTSSSSSSDGEEETTSKIVVINGITYLETTTISDGVTTVQRNAIND